MLKRFRNSHPETLAQVFTCEFYEISKSTFFYRTPMVAASGASLSLNAFSTCKLKAVGLLFCCFVSVSLNSLFKLAVQRL